MVKVRILIATTVPETIYGILRDQPAFLNKHFHIDLVTSPLRNKETLLHEGVPVHYVSMRRGISPLYDLISTWRMIMLLIELRPDIIHSYTPKAGLICMLASWICRVPVRIHTFTGLIWPTSTGLRRWVLIMVDKLLCACATHVVPEGLGVKLDLKRGNITSKPLRLIGNGNIAGVDVDFFSPFASGVNIAAKDLRSRFNIKEGDFVFIYVGRLNNDKGIQELIIAFETLPMCCHLLIVGSMDESAPISNKLLNRLVSHTRVHMVGFLKDVRPALFAANVLVLASYREGFPNVILQAGAMEVPVIASNISGCNEVIKPHINGWLVPVRDHVALADAMNIALKLSSKSLKLMGTMARINVISKFERNEHWERLLKFYKSVF
jgi:glycosyltransferase involved in cell wall biosynthesis